MHSLVTQVGTSSGSCSSLLLEKKFESDRLSKPFAEDLMMCRFSNFSTGFVQTFEKCRKKANWTLFIFV